MLREDTVKGIPAVIRHTVECLRGGALEDLSNYDIHVISNVLKMFFREMSVPLFTFELWDLLLAIADFH